MDVILVDDDAAVRSSLKLVLIGRGYRVRAFAGGQAVLDLDLRHERFCLIADFLMPEINGLSLLDRMRKQGWSGPALLITGHFDTTLETRALALGYTAVFEKPLRHELLLAAVADLVAV